MSSGQRPLAGGARDRLIESHLPLAKAVARRYAGRGVDLDDLVQVGAVGLIKAADRFDSRRGVAFATFAEPTIEGEIRHHLRDRSSALRIPRELQTLSTRLRRRQGELSARLGRAPTLSELADAVEADEREVARALAIEEARTSVSISPGETVVEVPTEAEPFAGTDDRLLLAARMHALDERERRLVYLRFHADMTERQIAGELGISQAHVSRLLATALAKLRAELASADSPEIPTDTTGAPGHTIGPVTEERAIPSRTRKGAKARSAAGYSGRFLVRLPSDLHQQLAQAAEQDEVSLNRFVTDALADSVIDRTGPDRSRRDPARADDGDRGVPGGRGPVRALRVALAANVLVVVLAGAVAVVLLVLALERGI
jgi:RNA polymerase sigma-B factor